MDKEEEEKDLKDEELNLSGEESTPEEKTPEGQPNPSDSEVVENTGEEVEEMLADGTQAKKVVTIPYDKFKEVNEESKLYKKFQPLLAKLKPDQVEKILELKDDETVEQRITRLEEELKGKRRGELKSALMDAIDLWGKDFKNRWQDISPIVSSLEKQGIEIKDAIQRAYFAVNPEVLKDKKLVEQAKIVQNNQGKVSSGGGFSKNTQQIEELDLPAEDMEVAKLLNIDPNLYKKHWDKVKHYNY